MSDGSVQLSDRITSLARRDALTTVGIGLTAAWLILLLLFWLLAPTPTEGTNAAGGLTRLVAMIGAVLPLALIWMAVLLGRAIAGLRAEADELRARLSQLREMAATRGTPPPSRTLPEPTEQVRPGGTTAPTPASQQLAAPRPAPAPAQPPRARPATDIRQQAMRFDAPEPVEIDSDTLIQALNFPDGPDDHTAIAALRTALRDHDSSRVLRAAQDVITLLAGHDVYMDDLPSYPAPAAIWRRFGEGERGSSVAPLGGVHDETALELTAALLRADEIFRDTAHHFLRHFDLMLTRTLPQLDDAQITVLADTRSARAFMLIGRAAGIFV